MPKRYRVGERYLLSPGAELQGKTRYRVQAYLGQGAFATAYRAEDEAGRVCFLKEYLPAQRPSQAEELGRVYFTECGVVRRLGNSELMPRFWDAFTQSGYSYLVTDFIPGPDLETVLRSAQKPALPVLVRWCVCLCHELAYMHQRSVVHHDLKPENIRLNEDGDPVIVDFSAAHWFRRPGETNDQLYGSDSFLAPEYQERSAEDAQAGMRMDVFALGRILVEMLTGERLSQEEIDRRHDQLYGQILHSGKLDVALVRAIFRAVSYDPQRRYASGKELADDILPAAPPCARVRPRQVDLGMVVGTAPREVILQCYNVGGGTLQGSVSAGADWLGVGAEGTATGPQVAIQRNRQSVRLVVSPERLAPGQEASGTVLFTFGDETREVPVRVRRGAEVGTVKVQPETLRLTAPPGDFGRATLTFTNNGLKSLRVRLEPPADVLLGVEPAAFVLPPHGFREVVCSIDSGVLDETELETRLRWTVEDVPRPEIRVRAGLRRGKGLLSGWVGRRRRD